MNNIFKKIFPKVKNYIVYYIFYVRVKNNYENKFEILKTKSVAINITLAMKLESVPKYICKSNYTSF